MRLGCGLGDRGARGRDLEAVYHDVLGRLLGEHGLPGGSELGLLSDGRLELLDGLLERGLLVLDALDLGVGCGLVGRGLVVGLLHLVAGVGEAVELRLRVGELGLGRGEGL